MPKNPSFQFYPGDWLRNEVAGCPLEAQGLWLRMMIVMHDAEVYGELSIDGQPMPDEFIAQKCGVSKRKYQKNLKFLESFRVINRDKNGVIFSGRMKRDEAKRQQNAARQRDHYDRHKTEPNAQPNAEPNKPLHSSSSISIRKTGKPVEIEIATGLSELRKELNIRKFSSLEERDWSYHLSLAFENEWTPAEFVECLSLLRKQKWRIGAVSPKEVLKNLPELKKLRSANGTTEPSRLPTPQEVAAADAEYRKNLVRPKPPVRGVQGQGQDHPATIH